MAFWDGERWIRPERPLPRTPRPASTRDWIATAVMAVMCAGLLLPMLPTQASGPSLAAEPASAAAGARVEIRGRGFDPRATVQITFGGDGAGMPQMRANAGGELRGWIRVPTVAPGLHTMAAVASTSGGRRAASHIVVLASVAFTVLLAEPAGAAPVPSVLPSALPTPSPTSIADATPSPTPAATPTPMPTPIPVSSPAAAAATQVPATAAPTPVPTAAPAAPAPVVSGFVSVCGQSLCGNGARWYLYGASVYGGLDDPAGTVARARAAGLNSIRIVNFLEEGGPVASAPFSEAHWARVDRLIGAAGGAGLKVILDLSTHRNLLANAGVNPYTHDWASFIRHAATRVNTATGARYADDPTIALIAFAGEVEPINTSDNRLGVTTAQVTTFFQRAFATWKSFDARHPVSSGGLLHYGWNSGIDWRAIFAAADVCSIHNYSESDTATTPTVASYCAGIGKPWITEEFGWERSVGDATRASLFQGIYTLQANNGSAGVAFWNLGPQTTSPTFDVNASTPLTHEVVASNRR